MDTLSNEKLIGYSKQKQAKKQTTRFVIKEYTRQKQEKVFEVILFMNYRKYGVYASKEYPKTQFSEYYRTLWIEHKELLNHLDQLINHVSILRWVFLNSLRIFE
jgi:hypothetical protein